MGMIHWLAKQALNQPAAQRIAQNYQLLSGDGAPPASDWLFHHHAEKVRMLSSPDPVKKVVHCSEHLTHAVEQWLAENDLCQRRTVLPVLRWYSLPRILQQIKCLLPAGFRLKIITADAHYQRLSDAESAHFFSQAPLMVVLLLDEYLPCSYRSSVKFNSNRLYTTHCAASVLQRLHLTPQTLLPAGCHHQAGFMLHGQRYRPEEMPLAIAETFRHLQIFPAYWQQWDDFSLLLQG